MLQDSTDCSTKVRCTVITFLFLDRKKEIINKRKNIGDGKRKIGKEDKGNKVCI